MYLENDYRSALRKALESRKKTDPKATYQNLAQAMRVQKSYLSKVLNQGAELSSDQLHLASKYLEFSEQQESYIELLLQHSRSVIPDRRTQILSKIQKIQAKNAETKNI